MKHLCIAVALLLGTSAGALSARTLSAIKVKNSYGYADDAGNIVIKPQYTQAFPFENGKAKVCKGDKWGYIDETGKPVIEIKYDNIEPFEKGIARVKKGKKYGYINDDGSVYIKIDYNFIGSFNDDGWLWVAKGKDLKSSMKGLYHHNTLVMDCFPTALGFYVNTDSIDYTSGLPVYVTNGEFQNNEIKTNFCRLSSSEHPFIWASFNNQKQTVFDLNGKRILGWEKGALGMPHDGMVLRSIYTAKKNGSYYDFNYFATGEKPAKLFTKDIRQMIDTADRRLSCQPFHNGLAICGTESTASLINTAGQKVTPEYNRLIQIHDLGYISKSNGKYGLLAHDGRETVAPFYSNLFTPIKGSEVFAADNSGKWGFIDISGATVIPFKYEGATAFFDGKGYVKENGFYGVIDSNGKYIVKNRWHNILPATVAGSDHIWVKQSDTSKWQCLKISTDAICFKGSYDGATTFDEKGRAFIKEGSKFGAVTTQGDIMLPLRFSDYKRATLAMKHLDSEGKTSMTDNEAYRYNIYSDKDRHKYRLSQAISDDMWDY